MIAVTGATGRVGRLVAEELTAHGEAIRLIVRDPERAPKLPNTEVAIADYGDRTALADALNAGDHVFMVSIHAPPDQRLELHRSFIETATSRNVAHITYLSFVNAGRDAVFLQARSHGATEELLQNSGAPWTSIRNSSYADDIPGWFDADGVLREAGADGRMSFSYRPEIARAIAVTLTESGHERAIYDITTPDTVSMQELAQIASQISGQQYRYEPISDDEWRSRWRAKGRSDWELEAGLTSYEALRSGELDTATDDYQRLTGLPPLTIRDIVERLADELPLTD
jgi:NAD(P)H dehydrogenase (quinone)